jgi:hypothetical protein
VSAKTLSALRKSLNANDLILQTVEDGPGLIYVVTLRGRSGKPFEQGCDPHAVELVLKLWPPAQGQAANSGSSKIRSLNGASLHTKTQGKLAPSLFLRVLERKVCHAA